MLDVLADQVSQLVGVLARGRHPDRPRPVVVHVGELVGEPLHVVRLHVLAAVHDNVVRWGHRAVPHVLGHQEKVVPVGFCDGVVNDSARRRVFKVGGAFLGGEEFYPNALGHNDN